MGILDTIAKVRAKLADASKLEVANATGLSRVGLYKIERGEVTPSVDTLLKLADHFNIKD